uniref:tRNA 2-selenouridine synthase AAA domain-containing protein n=1 Tax=Grammatophora oceanica TaxID=210454 RepID=A0A7S1VUJ8_9STRA|mmetsp:Transcript_8267/g.12072  ORF Transcript_8267/g.12072 Transcript_8267/m.12072 type:complete len:148 (+) Transcript_8267:2-445(+)
MEKMKKAKLAIVHENMEDRVDVIMQDYVCDLESRFIAVHDGCEELGRKHHREYLSGGMARIANRLGGDRYKKLSTLLNRAFQEQDSTGDVTLYRVWISQLLEQYYDPMYKYQLEKKQDQVVFRGNRAEVTEWAQATKVKGCCVDALS